MASEKPPMESPVYQLKVTLLDIAPPIWRRFQVEGDTTLYTLHHVLQIVMGWDDYHLYKFTLDRAEYGEPGLGLGVRSSRTARLSQIVRQPGARFLYLYDFGDNWEHEILVENIAPADAGVSYPVCLEGERACPPEDCGGVWGYTELLEIIRDPNHERYQEMMEWLGEEFDPEAFDLDRVNQELRKIVPSSKARQRP